MYGEQEKRFGWGGVWGEGGGNQSRNQNLIISYNIMYELIKSENVPPLPPAPPVSYDPVQLYMYGVYIRVLNQFSY